MPEEPMIQDSSVPTTVDNGMSTGEKEKFALHAQSIWDDIDRDAVPEPPGAKVQEPATPEPPKKSNEKEESVTASVKPVAPEANVEPEPVATPVAVPIRTQPEPLPDDFDSMTLPRGASEVQQVRFKDLKERTKALHTENGTLHAENDTLKNRINIYNEILGPRLKESGYETTDDPESLRTALAGFDEASRNARSNAMSPEVQAELEDARSLRKKLGVINNGHFIARHDNPINLKYSAIIDTVANRFAWQSQQAKNEYLQLAKSSRFWNPGRMDPEFDNWFQAQVNAMEASPVDKQTVWNEFAQLRQMQNERTQAAREYVSDNSRYEAFKAAEQEKFNQQYESQLKADVTSLCNAPESPWAYLKERMEKPLAAARDATERAAFEKHNREVYQPAHDLFRTVIGAVSSGTNGAARVALEFMRLSDMANVANDLARQLREAQEKVAELEKARGTLKKEVTTNRQVKDAWAKPRNGTSQPTPEKARLPKGPDGGLHKVFDTLNKEGWGQH